MNRPVSWMLENNNLIKKAKEGNKLQAIYFIRNSKIKFIKTHVTSFKRPYRNGK